MSGLFQGETDPYGEKNGRLITGKNCSNISIKHTNTKFVGLQHLDGTINCSNVKINGKSYNRKSIIN